MRGEPPGWRWWILTLEPSGRVILPAAARQVLSAAGGRAMVRGQWRDVALVVRPAGPGRSMAVDGRGPLVVPVWLRQAVDPSASVLVGVRAAVAPIVVVAPTRVLDGLGQTLAGEGR